VEDRAQDDETPERLLVDGMNVIGSRPDGWWRDRTGAMRRLVGELDAHAAATGAALTVVFDGRPRALGEERIQVAFAPGGRDAADRVIAAAASEDADPGSLRVVTSDRALAGAVRRAGARVEGAASFRRRLAHPSSDPPASERSDR
jgi:predicted RNA-binding protein with PIN domain